MVQYRTFTDNQKRTVYEAKIGNIKYQRFTEKELKKAVKNHREFENSGAANDYGTGTFNGD